MGEVAQQPACLGSRTRRRDPGQIQQAAPRFMQGMIGDVFVTEPRNEIGDGRRSHRTLPNRWRRESRSWNRRQIPPIPDISRLKQATFRLIQAANLICLAGGKGRSRPCSGETAGQLPQQIGFHLVPRFSMMSFASAIEPLRSANRLAGKTLYEWRIFAEEPDRCRPATASPWCRKAVVGGRALPGPDPVQRHRDGRLFDDRLFGQLRRLSRNGAQIGGLERRAAAAGARRAAGGTALHACIGSISPASSRNSRISR